MGSLGEQLPPADRLRGAPLGGGKSLLGMLLSAAITRLLLCAFLRQGSDSFRVFLGAGLDGIAVRLPWSRGHRDARRECLRALGMLAGTAPAASLGLAQQLYRALAGQRSSASSSAPPTLQSILQRDPVAAWLTPGPGRALPETRFASRALRYLGRRDPDSDFALFFWQYQRIRCLLYRHLAEEPGTAGLDWFTRHYARISPLRGPLEGVLYACALEVQGRDLNLGAIEPRTSPASSWTEVRDELRALARQALSSAPHHRSGPEVGLVFHFIKEWERKSPIRSSPQLTRLHGDPGNSAFGCRHGLWFWQRRQQSLALAAALRLHPELLLLLRGLDVANVELAQPSWLLPPLFRPIQEAALQAAARLAQVRPEWQVTQLRITLHAGEDFRRLIEGVRRMHEPIECGLLSMGDRIGHGIALGENPEVWSSVCRVVTQPTEDRLDDLLWEFERYRRAELTVDSSRAEYARAEILRLGRFLYAQDNDISVENLLDARLLRFSARSLSICGYPFARWRGSHDPAQRLLWRYLTDEAVFARGQRPLEVVADSSEVLMLHAAQRWLRGVLGRLEIHIESNPSSNLLIGNYLAIEQHPAFRMQPLPGAQPPDGGAVLLSVNTDNPLTFSSSLADEFAHIYFSLLRQNVPAKDALSWLEQVRQNGWRSRFTLPKSADADVLRELVARRPW